MADPGGSAANGPGFCDRLHRYRCRPGGDRFAGFLPVGPPRGVEVPVGDRPHGTIPLIPGLYAVGDARPDSPVFVTANYKMTFDLLRRALAGIDGWILVLDTKGINVWCAAGKGTFGTDELVGRIAASGLAGVVSHRRLIVPQLGAPGVSAYDVRRRSGFKVVYGPVRADDLPAFLHGGLKATGRMRTKDFPLAERLALVPIEVVPAVKWGIVAAAALSVLSFFISGFSPSKAAGWTLARRRLARLGGLRGRRTHARAAAVASRQGLFDKGARPWSSFRPLRCAGRRRAPQQARLRSSRVSSSSRQWLRFWR